MKRKLFCNCIGLFFLIMLSFSGFAQQISPKNDEQVIENKIRISELDKKVDQLKKDVSQETNDKIAESDEKLKIKNENIDFKQSAIEWWLAVIGIVLTIFALITPIAGFLFGKYLINDINKQKDIAKGTISEFIESSTNRLTKLEDDAKNCINHLQEYEKKGQDASEKLQKLAENTLNPNKTEEENRTSVIEAKAIENDPNSSPLNKAMAKAFELYFSKNNNKALEQFNIILQEYYKEITIEKLADIYFYIAIIYGENSDIDNAIEYNKKAIELNQFFPNAFCNFGVYLAKKAKTLESNSEKIEAYNQANLKYQKAIELKPNFNTAFSNWAYNLICLAKLAENNIIKEELLKQAIEKCKIAIYIKPNSPDSYNNWGLSLISLAEIVQSKIEKQKLYEKSILKYQKAIELKPNFYIVFANWGLSLKYLAELADNNIIKEELLKQAVEKNQKATELKFDYYEAFSNWGEILINLSKLKIGTEKEILLEEAKEKCERVIALGGSCYNLACVYALKEFKKDAFEWLEKALERKYIDWKYVSKDDDWNNYRNEQEYLQLEKKYLKS